METSIKEKKEETLCIETLSPSSVIIVIIDTTGFNLKRPDNICQIVAFEMKDEHESFSVYLKPQCSFRLKASEKNGFALYGRKLYHNGELVNAVEQEEGIQQFYEYLKQKTLIGNCVLISYEKGFLSRFLLQAFEKYCKVNPQDIESRGVRFTHLRPFLRNNKKDQLPGIENLQMKTVYAYLYPDEEEHPLPTAHQRAMILQKIITKLNISIMKLME